MSHTILRLPEVIARTGLSRSSIYQFIKNGNFPGARLLGKRAVGWVEADIADWISSRCSKAAPGAHGHTLEVL